jgi:hypothetical protein
MFVNLLIFTTLDVTQTYNNLTSLLASTVYSVACGDYLYRFLSNAFAEAYGRRQISGFWKTTDIRRLEDDRYQAFGRRQMSGFWKTTDIRILEEDRYQAFGRRQISGFWKTTDIRLLEEDRYQAFGRRQISGTQSDKTGRCAIFNKLPGFILSLESKKFGPRAKYHTCISLGVTALFDVLTLYITLESPLSCVFQNTTLRGVNIARKVARDSVIGIATRYGLVVPVIKSRWRERFPAPFYTGAWAHPVSYIGRGVALTTHPHPVPRLNKE